jgi:hypothetical protein
MRTGSPYYVEQKLISNGLLSLELSADRTQEIMRGKDRAERDYVKYSFKERLTLCALAGKKSEGNRVSRTCKDGVRSYTNLELWISLLALITTETIRDTLLRIRDGVGGRAGNVWMAINPVLMLPNDRTLGTHRLPRVVNNHRKYSRHIAQD